MSDSASPPVIPCAICGKPRVEKFRPFCSKRCADVDKLLQVLHRLVETGNTVLVIEHNLDVVKTSDWVIDLGPEGGAAG